MPDEGAAVDVTELGAEHDEIGLLGTGRVDECLTRRRAFAKNLSRVDPRFVGPLDRPSHHRFRGGDRRIVDGGAAPGKDPRQLIDPVDDVREQDFGAELGRDRDATSWAERDDGVPVTGTIAENAGGSGRSSPEPGARSRPGSRR